MAIEVKVPALGESISKGIIAKWHVADGASVAKGKPLFDLETDKITSEAVAEADGVVRHKAAAGDEVAIGQVVALIEAGAAPAAASAAPASSAPAADAKQSPAVARLAAETGVNPASVAGTGKDGRVTKGDMLAASEAKPAAAAPAPAAPAPVAAPKPSAPVSAAGRTTRRKMTPLRRKIADTLVAAKNQTALLTTFNECDMAPIMALRAKYQDQFTKKHGVKLGFMSFFLKAVVSALREVPAVNSSIEGDEIVQNNFYDIGVAVSTPKGLMVPVLRNVDQMSLADIEKALGAYATKARDGKITIEDLQGGGFTVTNGGIFGSLLSTPIINPPQSGILGMHSIKERPVVVDGQIVIRPMMYLAHSYDHRVIDGREAVTFLVKIKDALEDPARLLLDV